MLDKFLNPKTAQKTLSKGFSTAQKLATNSLTDKEIADLIYTAQKNGLSDREVAQLLEQGTKGYKFIQENVLSQNKKKN